MTKTLNPSGITHRQRVATFAACVASVGAPSTSEHFAKLAAPHYKSAKRLGTKPQTDRVRLQRFGALVTARAFFALSRRASS